MSAGWWIGFNAFVLAMLMADLGIFHRRTHEIRIREALLWSGVWIALALIFAAGLWHFEGRQAGLEFVAGWLIEKSLSVDNLFVFVLIFSLWQVPREYQHRVLFWGVLGALAMRAAMIFAGVALLTRFEWIIYPFGAFLLLLAFRMLLASDAAVVKTTTLERLVRRVVPVTPGLHGPRFFVRLPRHERLRLYATPLFVVLLAVEFSDLIFALDSIPAIFAVTRDPFIVYTSNIFAILGLRSLYFVIAGLVHQFAYLKPGVAIVLVFVGLKMLLSQVYHVSVEVSLGVIMSVLTVSIVASVIATRRQSARDLTTRDEDIRPA
ncbi:MAG TPA: TerC family protein [Longimicrobiales bacterium]|nr:TerC family protein [Longimicrobiales bacterium]